MKIVDFVREDLIVPDISARRKNEVIRELASRLADAEQVGAEEVYSVLLEREQLGSTALAEGIAIPHAKLDSIDHLVGCVGRSLKGVDFKSEDGSRTHLLFVLIAPKSSTGEHLKALARISRLFKNSSARARLMSAETASEMYAVIAEEDAASSR